MFWSLIAARLAWFGLFRPRRHKRVPADFTWGALPPPWPGMTLRHGNYVDNTRIFFECPNCPYFHEDTPVVIDCNYLSNRYRLDQLPCGDGADTEVYYLDGSIERVKQVQ